jgi:hypothetical protein
MIKIIISAEFDVKIYFLLASLGGTPHEYDNHWYERFLRNSFVSCGLS